MSWTKELSIIAGALIPVLKDTPIWETRDDVAWYIGRCQQKGFCNEDENVIRLYAERYLAGKRKISPPGTKRRKRQAAERRKMLLNLPQELIAAIGEACLSTAATQYKEGNLKALNAVVGMVMKKHKADPDMIKTLLIERLGVS